MLYDSLLMSSGGGIISTTQKSEQFGGAALCIGIGGTGVAALAELKRKVYQQLEPDDPNSPIPRYQHIQFLAIDSDNSAIATAKGSARLTGEEFFSIEMVNLAAAISEKKQIKQNPVMSWMNIDGITGLLNPKGAGGVRQVGRFLLLSKALQLKTAIEKKIRIAMEGTTSDLDIYVFAGISGGTGSGCFLDTCYIVRHVLKESGLSNHSTLAGFFFLPDVVTSKPVVACSKSAVRWNNSNGYAALKELDYLMNLEDAQDWFRQDYGAFSVETQDRPVNVFFLLSAQKADGTLSQNAFQYCIDTVAESVMTWLTSNQQDQTMGEYFAHIAAGVDTLPHRYGNMELLNQCYLEMCSTAYGAGLHLFRLPLKNISDS